MLKKLGTAAAAVIMFVSAYVLSSLTGGWIVRWLQAEQPALLYQYATDGRYSSNIYLSKETDSLYGVPGRLPELSATGDLSEVSKQILKNQWETAHALEQNEPYLQYLHQQGTSLSGFFSFVQKLAQVRDNLIYACRYLLFLLCVAALHLMMRCRPALYFSMGLLCILATSIKLSGKLAAVVVFGSTAVSSLITDGLLPPLLESMLTFLIFDITIAALEKVRLSHKVEALYQDLPALQYLVVQLAQTPDSETKYRSDLSRLLPRFNDYLRTGKRKRKKAKRLIHAIESLSGPHTNRSFLEAAVELQTLLPGK